MVFLNVMVYPGVHDGNNFEVQERNKSHIYQFKRFHWPAIPRYKPSLFVPSTGFTLFLTHRNRTGLFLLMHHNIKPEEAKHLNEETGAD